jgi:hypothetical protein
MNVGVDVVDIVVVVVAADVVVVNVGSIFNPLTLKPCSPTRFISISFFFFFFLILSLSIACPFHRHFSFSLSLFFSLCLSIYTKRILENIL